MNFIAIDVETANADMSSICQIGLAIFKDGKIAEEWETLVNPEQHFDEMNVSIHGIDESDVENAPTIRDLYEKLLLILEHQTIVSHMPFDRVAISRAFKRYELELLSCSWIDSAKVVRRTYKEFATKGYGLKNVAKKFNIEFNHHNALEDAKTAGKILVKALEESQITLDEMRERTHKPITSSAINTNKTTTGNLNGTLYGEVLVFTGALEIPRSEATKLASDAGCTIVPSMKKTVTILVIGDQDTQKLNGHEKSSKQRKAEELIQEGYDIKIIGESDFKQLMTFAYSSSPGPE